MTHSAVIDGSIDKLSGLAGQIASLSTAARLVQDGSGLADPLESETVVADLLETINLLSLMVGAHAEQLEVTMKTYVKSKVS